MQDPVHLTEKDIDAANSGLDVSQILQPGGASPALWDHNLVRPAQQLPGKRKREEHDMLPGMTSQAPLPNNLGMGGAQEMAMAADMGSKQLQTQVQMPLASGNPGSFADGFSQGFLSGMRYYQQNLQAQGTMQAVEQPQTLKTTPHMAKSWQVNSSGPHDERTTMFNITKLSPRRPYRFCSKCWIKHKRWVLRSIKLPSGRSINLHGETCPEWPPGEGEPNAEQIRAYGAAFKQAQRSSQLHAVALEAFKRAAPDMTDHELEEHLCN